MGTKQIRINDFSQIQLKIKELVGKNISIVLNDGNVFPGKINKLTDKEVILTNMRLKQVAIDLNKITELYYDTIV